MTSTEAMTATKVMLPITTRKNESDSGAHSDGASLTVHERKNTSVYVTGLPDDVTVEELKDHFVKCGIIMEDAVTGAPKIKIYSDEAGRLKGDALIIYFKIESVDLAVELLDESYLRPNAKIHVQKATFSNATSTVAPGLTGDKSQDLKLKKKKMDDMRRKLDWMDEAEMEGRQDEPFRKIVLLKHVFTPSELESDPSLALDLKEDMESECSKLGTVTSVQLFESSADGAVTIKYMDEVSAKACINMLQGRFYGGRRLEASLLDPETKRVLRMEHRASQKIMKSDPIESRRLETYGKWLETEEKEGSNEQMPHSSVTFESMDPFPLSHSSAALLHSSVEAVDAMQGAVPLPQISSEAAAAYATIEEGESLADRLRKKRKLQMESEALEQGQSRDVEDDLFEEETV